MDGHNHSSHMGHMMMNGSTTMGPHMHDASTTMDPHAGHHGMHATTPNPHAGHGASNTDHSQHNMLMYFHADVRSIILFQQWETVNWQGMFGSCAAIFFMAMMYEALKVFREYLLRRSNVKVRYNSMPVSSSQDTMIQETHKTVGARMCSWAHVIQTLLHVLQVIISYFLMLIFMTYNVWLCLAVALGAGTGYFIFGWNRAVVVDINEHCH